VDAREAVAAALETVRLAADAKRIDLRSTLPSEPQFVWADAERLQQVFWNLLANAVKFTPSGGRVEARLGPLGSRLALTVTDTGIGIRSDFLPHVFETFRQEDSSTTRAHGGLGLGLAIAKRLVELHGGEIEAYSEGEGKGTTMRVILPVMAVVGRPPTAEPGHAAVIRLDGVSILVVDDHEDSRDLLAALLQSLGAVVYGAAGAVDALALLRARRPDVLLSDIEMPGASGYELIRDVRALPPMAGGLTPAIALTAYARDEDRARVLAAGFQTHLAKPALPADIVNAVATVLALRREA
jgi:CheY-like chemotaxis protein/anti-sigma regulatory factor (Ser/Thr protein kinase)